MEDKISSKISSVDFPQHKLCSPRSKKFNEMIEEWEEFKKSAYNHKQKIHKHSLLGEKDILANLNGLTADKSINSISSKLVFCRKSKSSSKKNICITQDF